MRSVISSYFLIHIVQLKDRYGIEQKQASQCIKRKQIACLQVYNMLV